MKFRRFKGRIFYECCRTQKKSEAEKIAKVLSKYNYFYRVVKHKKTYRIYFTPKMTKCEWGDCENMANIYKNVLNGKVMDFSDFVFQSFTTPKAFIITNTLSLIRDSHKILVSKDYVFDPVIHKALNTNKVIFPITEYKLMLLSIAMDENSPFLNHR